MKPEVLVVLAGIADPKWPLPAGELSLPALLAHRAAHEVLSPFDEAALELALKLRDADPSVRITAAAFGGEALVRKVAGFRLDRTIRVDSGDVSVASSPALAASLAQLVAAVGGAPDLVLVGREFGDYDDGTVPASMAERLGLGYVSLAVSAEAEPEDAGVRIVRAASAGLQHLRSALPVLASVTNDARNRLRQPLLKNVMAARKLALESVRLEAPERALELAGIARAVEPVRERACRFLEGTPARQAEQLAKALASVGARP